jgi:hypothetical protein
MSKRLIRPTEQKSENLITVNKEMPHHSKFGTHKYNFNRDMRNTNNKTVIQSDFSKSPSVNKGLTNQRMKASNEFGKNLHLNRDTSQDNMLNQESKSKASKVLTSFTHSHAL